MKKSTLDKIINILRDEEINLTVDILKNVERENKHFIALEVEIVKNEFKDIKNLDDLISVLDGMGFTKEESFHRVIQTMEQLILKK